MLYTFGMPRIGNERFAEYAHSMYPKAYRVTHWRDPVPHIPLEDMGFI
jgi:predicted lipase